MASLAELVREDYTSPMEPPPPARDPLTFIRSLMNPKGEFAGQPYEPALHPAQLVFWVVYCLCRYVNWVLAADAQSGKSWLIQCILFYHAIELRRDVLYGLPDMRFASDVWHKKIAEAMEKSGLKHHLPTSGSGSGGGADIDTVYLVNAGSIEFHGANGKNKGGGNDGRTIPTIIDDEFDSLPPKIIAKNEHRADSYFRQAQRLRASTVKDDDQSNILQSYDNSTRARTCYECPHCHLHTTFDFERFTADTTTDDSAAASARIGCQHCDVALTEDERQTMIARPRLILADQTMDQTGRIVGDDPLAQMVNTINDTVAKLWGSTVDATAVIAAAPTFPRPPGGITFGIRWSRFDNPFKSLGETAQSYRAALMAERVGNAEPIIDFFHEVLARQYPRKASETDTDPSRLVLRSAESSYDRNTVPSQALFLTANIDQQKRLLVWLVKAHDREGRTWRIAWGKDDICGQREEPTDAQRIAALDRVRALLTAGFPRIGGSTMTPVIIGLDVAEWPDKVAAWARSKRDIMPTHGTGREQVARMKRGDGRRVDDTMLEGWYDLREQHSHGGTWRILWLDSDPVKHELSRSFARATDEPGSSMLPRGLSANSDNVPPGQTDLHLIDHLTSERWTKDPKTGKHHWTRVQGHAHNDLWDCDYVTQALGMYFITKNPKYTPPNPNRPKGSGVRSNDAWGSGLGWT
jgi:phage terminase large subunit GpA-like protein